MLITSFIATVSVSVNAAVKNVSPVKPAAAETNRSPIGKRLKHELKMAGPVRSCYRIYPHYPYFFDEHPFSRLIRGDGAAKLFKSISIGDKPELQNHLKGVERINSSKEYKRWYLLPEISQTVFFNGWFKSAFRVQATAGHFSAQYEMVYLKKDSVFDGDPMMLWHTSLSLGVLTTRLLTLDLSVGLGMFKNNILPVDDQSDDGSARLQARLQLFPAKPAVVDLTRTRYIEFSGDADMELIETAIRFGWIIPLATSALDVGFSCVWLQYQDKNASWNDYYDLRLNSTFGFEVSVRWWI